MATQQDAPAAAAEKHSRQEREGGDKPLERVDRERGKVQTSGGREGTDWAQNLPLQKIGKRRKRSRSYFGSGHFHSKSQLLLTRGEVALVCWFCVCSSRDPGDVCPRG